MMKHKRATQGNVEQEEEIATLHDIYEPKDGEELTKAVVFIVDTGRRNGKRDNLEVGASKWCIFLRAGLLQYILNI